MLDDEAEEEISDKKAENITKVTSDKTQINSKTSSKSLVANLTKNKPTEGKFKLICSIRKYNN